MQQFEVVVGASAEALVCKSFEDCIDDEFELVGLSCRSGDVVDVVGYSCF